jgi:hypothetical protein
VKEEKRREKGKERGRGGKENVWLDSKKYILTLAMVWAETLGSFGARYAQKDTKVSAPTNCLSKS